MEQKTLARSAYRRCSWLGALGAVLMLVGDLCLSVIPASPDDSGLFLRETYLSGNYAAWRLPLLLATGVIGIALCSFAVQVCCAQIRPQYCRLRRFLGGCGIIYITSACTIHFMIGSLADWTSTLSPLLGRQEAAALVQAQYARVAPTVAVSYAGMILFILCSAWAVLTKKTILPRKMFVFHVIVWQLVFVLIPDIRQALGTPVSTWDFVLSQGSGNAALCIWMIANAMWAGTGAKEEKLL